MVLLLNHSHRLLPPHPLQILLINPRQVRPQNIVLVPDIIQLRIQRRRLNVLCRIFLLQSARVLIQ